MARDMRHPWLDWSDEHVRYPNHYAWFVLASALDLMLTWAVLWLGGSEVNPLAAAVLGSSGFAGMIVFKFSIVALVVAICEVVGRSRWTTGRRLSIAAVVISASPILWSMMLIARHLHG